ncbi:MAG: NAD(P)/FAD-dependent oxidoreductase [Sphingomonadales bacterium]
MTDRVECVVIGAGVVGLACAAALARQGREVVVLEAESALGRHASSRNSEVIHAGIYYPPGSLKAVLCRAGKAMLYDFARNHGVEARPIGKLIVAEGLEQESELKAIHARAEANGVTDLRWLDRADIGALEPAVCGQRGLFSPSTGIVDAYGLMQALDGVLRAHGGMVALDTRVLRGQCDGSGVTLTTDADGFSLKARWVVNAAGLWAPDLARRLDGLAARHVPQAYYAIGHYYRLSGAAPCAHLVYPVPEPGGLGVHLTLDMAGQAKFGPDVRWIKQPDYRFDDSARPAFIAAIKRYLPDIDAERLQPDYTGIRPKLVGPGAPAADFRIDGPEFHGVPGLVNLFGIESPGLTSSLAIAKHVAALLQSSHGSA